jgi:hypothetical protein
MEQKDCMINICKTNEVRKEVNEQCLQKFIKNKATIQIQDMTLCQGMPLMAYDNLKHEQIYNS